MSSIFRVEALPRCVVAALVFAAVLRVPHADALELPRARSVPGGVALVDLGPALVAPQASADGVPVLVSGRPGGWTAVVGIPLEAEPVAAQRRLLDVFLARRPAERRFLWYYTPMALAFSDHLDADATVFDCMDELSAFKDPPPGLLAAEARLFDHVDVVFTGGPSLFEAKRGRHPHVLCFPSSIDAAHFGQARRALGDPVDQAAIARPRICGSSGTSGTCG